MILLDNQGNFFELAPMMEETEDLSSKGDAYFTAGSQRQNRN